MTLNQGHISKVTVQIYPKSVSRPEQFLISMLDLDDISHNCCTGPKDVS